MRLQDFFVIFLLCIAGTGSAGNHPGFPSKEISHNNRILVSDQENRVSISFLTKRSSPGCDNGLYLASGKSDLRSFSVGLADSTEEYLVRVLITSATTRSYNAETRRLKSMTQAYNRTIRKLFNGKHRRSDRFRKLESGILFPYQTILESQIEAIDGVVAKFGPPFIGSWQGHFEPSFDLLLHISDSADTPKLSDLVFDLAERTSQDAIILEMESELEVGNYRTFFDDEGILHYPQIRVRFGGSLNLLQKASIASQLHRYGISDFSIGKDFIFVSIISLEDVSPEYPTERDIHLDQMMRRITQAVDEVASIHGDGLKAKVEVVHLKSKYVETVNTQDAKNQFRKYKRNNIFEALLPFVEN